MPGSSKDAHELVPSLSDGMAIKVDETSNPIPIAMVSLACMAHLCLSLKFSGGIREEPTLNPAGSDASIYDYGLAIPPRHLEGAKDSCASQHPSTSQFSPAMKIVVPVFAAASYF